ncbi:zinc ribbon domain-containing protein [Antarcticibacterium sp. 1MA-6-2]|uniref:zinc ribbon domain-containing protein n=1 Tax=Antarcticibacterium sp. 1MA-6-2 TaxID=2908210 RepID=UPI001F2285BD|nr:zinc ribbon domain-containing protein [Antarcticibacterium sp. 1MA-6-2]UJH91369.1 zinc ribbon domain-containing protein [Antarcticibacterium sp. 1MA-6-2]
MKDLPICQSCAVTLNEENKGTNRDRSINQEYCRSCFDNGKFLDPSLSLHCLEVQIMEMAKVHNDFSLEEAQQMIKLLPGLKRWKMNHL